MWLLGPSWRRDRGTNLVARIQALATQGYPLGRIFFLVSKAVHSSQAGGFKGIARPQANTGQETHWIAAYIHFPFRPSTSLFATPMS
jgi:hypothetical protein